MGLKHRSQGIFPLLEIQEKNKRAPSVDQSKETVTKVCFNRFFLVPFQLFCNLAVAAMLEVVRGMVFISGLQ